MPQRILVVDDDLFLRELYVEVLQDEGYDVHAAHDGQEGLEKMKQGGYDLILLDVMMPKLDGLGVLGKIKDYSPTKKNGPIILLTNLAHDPIIQEALRRGAHSFLIKTDITPRELLNHIKEYLK